MEGMDSGWICLSVATDSLAMTTLKGMGTAQEANTVDYFATSDVCYEPFPRSRYSKLNQAAHVALQAWRSCSERNDMRPAREKATLPVGYTCY